MKALMLLVTFLWVTTILAENHVHPKLSVTDINSRNGDVTKDQEDIAAHLDNTNSHIDENRFKTNGNFDPRKRGKRYKVKIKLKSREHNDLRSVENDKATKYKVMKQQDFAEKNGNVINRSNEENDFTRRVNGEQYNVEIKSKNKEQEKEHIEDYGIQRQVENGKGVLITENNKNRKYSTLFKNNGSNQNVPVDSGFLLTHEDEGEQLRLSQKPNQKKYSVVFKQKNNVDQINTPSYRRIQKYWKPQYNTISRSIYDDKSPTSLLANAQRSIEFPLRAKHLIGGHEDDVHEHHQLVPRKLHNIQDNSEIKYVFVEDEKQPIEVTETKPQVLLPTLPNYERETNNVIKPYVTESSKSVHMIHSEHPSENKESKRQGPLIFNNKPVIHPKALYDYEFYNEPSDYYYVFQNLNALSHNALPQNALPHNALPHIALPHNPPTIPYPISKGYTYEGVNIIKPQSTIKPNIIFEPDLWIPDYRQYDHDPVLPFELSRRTQLRTNKLHNKTNVDGYTGDRIPKASTDSHVSEPVHFYKNEEKIVTLNPKTVGNDNNELRTEFIATEVISEDIGSSDDEKPTSAATMETEVISIKKVKDDVKSNRKEEDIDRVIDNSENGFLKIQPGNSDKTKQQNLAINDVLDLCMSVNANEIVEKFHLNRSEYVEDLEKFQQSLEQFIRERPDSSLQGAVLKLLTKVYLIVQQIKTPSSPFHKHNVDSILERTVLPVDGQNVDILKIIKKAVGDIETPAATINTQIKPQNVKYIPENKSNEFHIPEVMPDPVFVNEKNSENNESTETSRSSHIHSQELDLITERENYEPENNVIVNPEERQSEKTDLYRSFFVPKQEKIKDEHRHDVNQQLLVPETGNVNPELLKTVLDRISVSNKSKESLVKTMIPQTDKTMYLYDLDKEEVTIKVEETKPKNLQESTLDVQIANIPNPEYLPEINRHNSPISNESEEKLNEITETKSNDQNPIAVRNLQLVDLDDEPHPKELQKVFIKANWESQSNEISEPNNIIEFIEPRQEYHGIYERPLVHGEVSEHTPNPEVKDLYSKPYEYLTKFGNQLVIHRINDSIIQPKSLNIIEEQNQVRIPELTDDKDGNKEKHETHHVVNDGFKQPFNPVNIDFAKPVTIRNQDESEETYDRISVEPPLLENRRPIPSLYLVSESDDKSMPKNTSEERESEEDMYEPRQRFGNGFAQTFENDQNIPTRIPKLIETEDVNFKQFAKAPTKKIQNTEELEKIRYIPAIYRVSETEAHYIPEKTSAERESEEDVYEPIQGFRNGFIQSHENDETIPTRIRIPKPKEIDDDNLIDQLILSQDSLNPQKINDFKELTKVPIDKIPNTGELRKTSKHTFSKPIPLENRRNISVIYHVSKSENTSIPEKASEETESEENLYEPSQRFESGFVEKLKNSNDSIPTNINIPKPIESDHDNLPQIVKFTGFAKKPTDIIQKIEIFSRPFSFENRRAIPPIYGVSESNDNYIAEKTLDEIESEEDAYERKQGFGNGFAQTIENDENIQTRIYIPKSIETEDENRTDQFIIGQDSLNPQVVNFKEFTKAPMNKFPNTEKLENPGNIPAINRVSESKDNYIPEENSEEREFEKDAYEPRQGFGNDFTEKHENYENIQTPIPKLIETEEVNRPDRLLQGQDSFNPQRVVNLKQFAEAPTNMIQNTEEFVKIRYIPAIYRVSQSEPNDIPEKTSEERESEEYVYESSQGFKNGFIQSLENDENTPTRIYIPKPIEIEHENDTDQLILSQDSLNPQGVVNFKEFAKTLTKKVPNTEELENIRIIPAIYRVSELEDNSISEETSEERESKVDAYEPRQGFGNGFTQTHENDETIPTGIYIPKPIETYNISLPVQLIPGQDVSNPREIVNLKEFAKQFANKIQNTEDFGKPVNAISNRPKLQETIIKHIQETPKEEALDQNIPGTFNGSGIYTESRNGDRPIAYKFYVPKLESFNTDQAVPEISKEPIITKSKDPVSLLLRELESNKDSSEDLGFDNDNNIDFDLAQEQFLEALKHVCICLRKHNVPERVIRIILKKIFTITLRKMAANIIKCTEKAKFEQFVRRLKSEVAGMDYSKQNDKVNVSKVELKQILSIEELQRILRQLFEAKFLVVPKSSS